MKIAANADAGTHFDVLRSPRQMYGWLVVTGLVSLTAQVFARAPKRQGTPRHLTRSLRTMAQAKVVELRQKAAVGAGVVKVQGKYLRTPQCLLQDITYVQVTRGTGPGTYNGVVHVEVEWRLADQSLCESRAQAEALLLTKTKRDSAKLLFTYQRGKWLFERIRANTPA